MANNTAVTDRVRQLTEETDEEPTSYTLEIEIDDLDLFRIDEVEQVLDANTTESSGPAFMATDELKRLLDPPVKDTRERGDADLWVEDSGDNDNDAGFDPYNR